MKKAIVCVMTVVAFLTFTVLAMADQKAQPQKASSPPPQKMCSPALLLLHRGAIRACGRVHGDAGA